MRGWRSVFVVVCALIFVLVMSSCGSLSDHQTLRGTVVDKDTGEKINEATVLMVTDVEQEQTQTDAGGKFALTRVSSDVTLVVWADGYQSQSIANPLDGTEVRLIPNIIEASLIDADSQTRITTGTITCDTGEVDDIGNGMFRIERVKSGSVIRGTSDGYVPDDVTYDGRNSLKIPLHATTLTGSVSDLSDGKSISGATVRVGDVTALTGTDGRFRLVGFRSVQEPLEVSAPGYKDVAVDIGDSEELNVSLGEFEVKAPYITFNAAGSIEIMKRITSLVDTTELNAVVIDIKGDRGWIAYQSDVPLANAIGANEVHSVSDIEALLSILKKKNVYTIARIVTFKDNLLAMNGSRAGLDVAVKDRATGQPWVDGEGLGWVDPCRQEVWDYNLALAKEAAAKGFDEIQFDYVRFPTDPSPDTSVERTVFSKPNNEANRLEAIANFLRKAKEELKPMGVNTSVDVFGYTCWRDDDLGIGQKIDVLGQHVDFVCPMLYPSTFSSGIPGYADAVGHPYEIVYYSTQRAVAKLQGLSSKVRPWLQYFDDYSSSSGRAYNADEIVAQKRAAVEAGACGWQVWDPFVAYERGGLVPD